MNLVYHLTPKLSERVDDPAPGHVVLVNCLADGTLDCLLCVSVAGKPNRIGVPFRASLDGNGTIWRLRKLGSSVWNVEPSIDHPVVHAFVTICAVPDPAPWEQ